MKKIALLLAGFLWINGLVWADVYQAQRQDWLKKAEAATPELHKTIVRPVSLVKSVSDPDAYQDWRMEVIPGLEEFYKTPLKRGDSFILDFGRHMTGYYTFTLSTLERAQDAPVRIKFTFAEMPVELNTPFDPYPGGLGRAWLQDEIITLPYIDKPITIERRLACRYVKIEVLGDSSGFQFAMSDMYFTALSSAPDINIELAETTPAIIRDINRVSIETLRECMQTVYEDGPKRDQRLWIGDLYLESIANAQSFKQFDLTKRCLYLLAALSAEDGQLHANVFEKPHPHPQYGTICQDYSLLYNVALLEYLKDTGDKETALDLWPVVVNQIKMASTYLDETHLYNPQKNTPLWLFFDWRSGLDTYTPMQGLFVFALNKSYELARLLGKEKEAKEWPVLAKRIKKSARERLYNKKEGYFVSGPNKQISYMSQIWMILSGVLSAEEGQKALKQVMTMPEAVYPGTPYAYHYLVEAMIKCGMKKEARQLLIDYWGSMVQKGADTFWEAYDPKDDFLSPYNFAPMNSYCHAWSCTPIYFIQRYPEIFQK